MRLLSDGTYHVKVLSRLVCGRQRCKLLESQADRILASESGIYRLATILNF